MAMNTPEQELVAKLQDLKYEYRHDIRDRATLEANFREKFEALNRVTLTNSKFLRLLDEIITPDVYEAARSLRNREAFVRDVIQSLRRFLFRSHSVFKVFKKKIRQHFLSNLPWFVFLFIYYQDTTVFTYIPFNLYLE